jgi:hypothetical protein
MMTVGDAALQVEIAQGVYAEIESRILSKGPAPNNSLAVKTAEKCVQYYCLVSGGVVLNLKYHWERVLLPRGLMIGHALLAVIGFVLVLIVAWSGR